MTLHFLRRNYCTCASCDVDAKMINSVQPKVCVFFTCSSTLLAVAEGGGPETPQPEGLGPLLPCCVTCLVGMPQLFAVVAELCPAALTPTGDLWAAGTAKCNDSVSD